MKRDSLGDRMKSNYENRSKTFLIRRMPVILRLDGKAFHTLTRKAEKPFDTRIEQAMSIAMQAVCKEVSGAKIAFTQSDEISILLVDYDKLTTEAYFDYQVQKMCSVCASIASVAFTLDYGKTAHFDCRVFNIPKEEVSNYFLWRQKDWIRNSVSMLAQAYFSQKQLHKKSQQDMHEMLHSIGINWAHLEDRRKNGLWYFTQNKLLCGNIILNQDRHIIDSIVNVEE